MRNNQKKPYEKPKVARFPLRPEEAVLGSCKNANGGGPGQAGCNDAFGGPCKIKGS
jgi:hypothetical protein